MFDVIPSDFDESTIHNNDPAFYVKALAKAKAEVIAQLHPDAWVIGADTIVTMDGVVLGKPENHGTARAMLERLSGATHHVFTGYAICCGAQDKCLTDAVCTEVTFKTLSEDEIEWYIHTNEPFDKAGAYAIQGLGTFLVKCINGSYTNVVGLPVCEVVSHLIKEGVLRIEKGTRGDDSQ